MPQSLRIDSFCLLFLLVLSECVSAPPFIIISRFLVVDSFSRGFGFGCWDCSFCFPS